MVFSTRDRTEQKQQSLNTQEVFSFWDLLRSNYFKIDTLNIFVNLAHYSDFKMLLQRHLSHTKKEAKQLEEQFVKYAIGAPTPPRKDVRSPIKTEFLTDRYFASVLMLIYQEAIELKLKAFRSAITNDGVRQEFLEYTQKAIMVYDELVKYLKLRGWLEKPALYPNLPLDAPEQLDVGEAYHLWDHLTFRYDNIEQTQIFYEMAQDGDFKLLLKKGIQDVLNKDVIRLERELNYFGITLPSQPKRLYKNLGNVEFVDNTMFKQLYSGMQSAAAVHSHDQAKHYQRSYT